MLPQIVLYRQNFTLFNIWAKENVFKFVFTQSLQCDTGRSHARLCDNWKAADPSGQELLSDQCNQEFLQAKGGQFFVFVPGRIRFFSTLSDCSPPDSSVHGIFQAKIQE